MDIDIRKITEELIQRLESESIAARLRSEGVKLLYESIRQAAEQYSKSVGTASEEAESST